MSEKAPSPIEILEEAIEERGTKPPLFEASQVDDVLGFWTDSDEPEHALGLGGEGAYVWLLKLKDGRYATAEGGRDYTGWDCQAHLNCFVKDTLEDAIRLGLTVNARDHLGLTLADETV